MRVKLGIKRKVAAAAAAIGMLGSGGAFALAIAAPAGATSANGGVYGILAPSDGWCSHPWIVWTNATTGNDGYDYTGSDDIFWLPVRLDTENQVYLQVLCGSEEKTWGGSVKATKTGQSVFLRYPTGYTLHS